MPTPTGSGYSPAVPESRRRSIGARPFPTQPRRGSESRRDRYRRARATDGVHHLSGLPIDGHRQRRIYRLHRVQGKRLARGYARNGGPEAGGLSDQNLSSLCGLSGRDWREVRVERAETSGRLMGMISSTWRTVPPPLTRRLAGSSMIEAFRALPNGGATICPIVPRAPT